MRRLIIKENMGSKGLEDRAFSDAAEEKGLVDPYVPCPQRADNTLVRGRVARRNKRRADGHSVALMPALNQRDGPEKLGKGTLGQGKAGIQLFVLGKGGEAPLAVYSLRLVREYDGIAVECDSDLGDLVFGVYGEIFVRADDAGGNARIDGLLNIILIGRKE